MKKIMKLDTWVSESENSKNQEYNDITFQFITFILKLNKLFISANWKAWLIALINQDNISSRAIYCEWNKYYIIVFYLVGNITIYIIRTIIYV